jgi:hypothetical protein
MAAKKKPSVRKSRVEKLFNNNTMSKAMFFSMIRSALRQKSRWWKPIAQCKLNAKRAYKGPLKRQKFEYQCKECNNWFPEKEIAVDHIVPAGELNDFNDLPDFCKRLFCEVDGLQVLCNNCHTIKTQLEKENRKTK